MPFEIAYMYNGEGDWRQSQTLELSKEESSGLDSLERWKELQTGPLGFLAARMV